MQMTNDEIKRRFKDAEDKQAQIQILADLNGCSKAYICGILELPVAEKPRKNMKLIPVPINKPSELQMLVNEGITSIDKQIEFLNNKIARLQQKRKLLEQILELEE